METGSSALTVGSGEERGSWPTWLATLVALIPLGIGLTIAIAVNGKAGLGPLTADQILWWILLPLGALYPAIASMARIRAYAPTTVLVVAALAPGALYAVRLLLDAMPTDGAGRTPVSLTTIASTAIPPAILAGGTFVAIEIATAGIRRGVLLGVAGSVVGAAVLGLAAAASVFLPGMITT